MPAERPEPVRPNINPEKKAVTATALAIVMIVRTGYLNRKTRLIDVFELIPEFGRQQRQVPCIVHC